MAYCIKIKVTPSTNRNLKYYIYRSKNQNDINTIAKVKNLLPVLVLNEAEYDPTKIEDDKYVLYDNQTMSASMTGISYVGPEPIAIPANEYETVFSNNQYNDYTYSIVMTLNPLPITYNGIVYYYSVIGVDETTQTITHLSKVQAELLLSDFSTNGTRELFYCNEYTGFPTDEWHPLTTPDWNTEIVFGDIKNAITYNRFGSPFVETVPVFNKTEIESDIKCAALFNHITLRIPNVWRLGNETYNYRKLKSFKLRNIYDGKYGDFSEPTYQSKLPLSIERMLVYRKDITVTQDKNPVAIVDTDNLCMSIIRKNGLYYNDVEHRLLGFNKYNISESEKTAVFSESSIQEKIVVDFEASGGSIYNYTFYIQDVYGKYSEPIMLIIET